MTSWMEEMPWVQFVGLSARPDLQEEVANLFELQLRLREPDLAGRFKLLAWGLGRRLERAQLDRPPARLLELHRATRRLNCGQTLQRLERPKRSKSKA